MLCITIRMKPLLQTFHMVPFIFLPFQDEIWKFALIKLGDIENLRG